MKKCLLLALLFASIACKNKNQAPKLEPAQWMLGEWEQKTNKGMLTESWQRQNDSVFVGKCFFINETDTLHHEIILLEQRADSITYSATVRGQNQDKAVPFALTSSANQTLVFENPAHDYPQKIVYQKNKTNSFQVIISGNLHGKTSVEKYNFSKK